MKNKSYPKERDAERYADAISDNIFGCKVKELTSDKIVTLKLNMMVRKRDGEFDLSMFEKMNELIE